MARLVAVDDTSRREEKLMFILAVNSEASNSPRHDFGVINSLGGSIKVHIHRMARLDWHRGTNLKRGSSNSFDFDAIHKARSASHPGAGKSFENVITSINNFSEALPDLGLSISIIIANTTRAPQVLKIQIMTTTTTVVATKTLSIDNV